MILFVQILLKRDFQRCISISCQQHPSKRAKWVCYGVLQMKFLIRFNIYNEIANACIFILNKTALNAFALTDSWFLTPSFNRKYENVNKFSLKKKKKMQHESMGVFKRRNRIFWVWAAKFDSHLPKKKRWESCIPPYTECLDFVARRINICVVLQCDWIFIQGWKSLTYLFNCFLQVRDDCRKV